MKNDLISIIVPVYNVEKYLAVCIESLIAQTYKDFEILLIDDGSTDGSGEICDKYKQMDSRIKVFHQQNEGVSNARNVGLRYCKGEYIVFVDSDDCVKSNYLELLYKNLLNYHVDISCCNFICFDEKKELKENSKLKSKLIVCNSQINYCKYSFLANPWGKLFSKRLLENIFFDTDIYIGEDSLFVTQVIRKADTLYFDSEALYKYRNNPHSVTKSSDSKKWNTAIIAWDKIAAMYEEGSMAYWSAKFFCLSVCRQIVNYNNDQIMLLKNEIKKHKTAFFIIPNNYKEKILILLLSYVPALYFKLFQKYKNLSNT